MEHRIRLDRLARHVDDVDGVGDFGSCIDGLAVRGGRGASRPTREREDQPGRPRRAETAATFAAAPPRCTATAAGVSDTGSISVAFTNTTMSVARSPTLTITAEPEILSIWQETMETPCVAIGGITVATARELARAGADFLAVSAGVWAHPDGPAAAVAAFEREMAAGVAERG